VSVEDDKSSGSPSTNKTTESVEKTWEFIHEDRCRTIHELTDTAGISYGVCQEMLTENFNMHRTTTKFVPQLLTNDQKQRRVNVYLELWEKPNEDPTFISRIITGDKNWIDGYDLERKQQSLQRKSTKSPKAKKVRQVQSSTKSMLIVFSTRRGLFTMNLFHLILPSTMTLQWRFQMLERKYGMKKTKTLAQPQLAPS
jgi:hypothetical protein